MATTNTHTIGQEVHVNSKSMMKDQFMKAYTLVHAGMHTHACLKQPRSKDKPVKKCFENKNPGCPILRIARGGSKSRVRVKGYAEGVRGKEAEGSPQEREFTECSVCVSQNLLHPCGGKRDSCRWNIGW